MTGVRTRRWLWSLVRFAIAVSLVSFAAGALHYVIQPKLVDDLRPAVQRWLPGRSTPPKSGDDRALPRVDDIRSAINLRITPQKISGSYTLRLPKADPLVLLLQHRVADGAGYELAPYAGAIKLGREQLAPRTAHFILAPQSPDAVITGEFDELDIPKELAGQRWIALQIEPSYFVDSCTCEAEIVGQGVELRVLGRQPVAQSGNDQQTVLRFTVAPHDRSVRVLAVLPQPKQSAQKRIGDLIQEITRRYIYILDPLAYGILNALPFLLALPLFHDQRKRFLPVIAFASLFLTLGVFRIVEDLFWVISEGTWRDYPSLSFDGIGTVAMVFVAWIWPLSVSRLKRFEGEQLVDHFAPRFRIARIGAALLALGAMVWAIRAQEQAVLAIALLTSLIWLALEVDGRIGVVLLEVTVALLAIAAYFFLEPLMYASHPLRIGVLWLYAFPFVLAVVHLLDVRTPRRFVIPLVAAAALLLILVREGDSITTSWLIPAMAWDFGLPLTLLLLALLVHTLYAMSKDDEWTKLEANERDAGTVVILIALGLLSRNWLSVPIALTIAWLLLKRWLFANEPGSDDASTIHDLIRYNEGRRALAALKRELAKSAGSGTISFNDYRMKVEAAEAYVDELAKSVGGVNAPRAALLSSGTPMKPWDRAVIAAQYAFLAALPWIGVFVYNAASATAPAFGFRWLGVIGNAIYSVAEWPLYGFFFGYFYPHIRGNSGVTKGLSVFTLFALPLVAAQAITLPLDANAWTSLTFWVLQLLLCMLIAGMFAGDLETLHRSGLGWRHLLEVHDLGALTAYASTVVAALGAAVTTYLAAQVPTVLTWTMQYFNQGPPR